MQLAQFRNHPDLHVAFVCLVPPEEAEAERLLKGISQPFICDPGGRLYDAFAIGRASVGQVLHPSAFFRAVRHAWRHPQTRLRGDKKRLPGLAILDGEGKTLWSRAAAHVADIPSPDEVRERLEAAEREVGA